MADTTQQEREAIRKRIVNCYTMRSVEVDEAVSLLFAYIDSTLPQRDEPVAEGKAEPVALAQLRHLYENMVHGAVRDTASAKRIATGLLGPAIESLERAAEMTGIEPVGHLHSNNDFCLDRSLGAVDSWPVPLYTTPPSPSLRADAEAQGFDSIEEYVTNLKTSASTYFAERNSARDAYRRHRDESEARGKLINIVLGMVDAPPGSNVVQAVAAALARLEGGK